MNSKYKFTDADNHSVFVVLTTTAKSVNTGKTASGVDESSRENNVLGSWSTFSVAPWRNLYLPTAGNITASGKIKTCLDIPARPDSCSASVTKTVTFAN